MDEEEFLSENDLWLPLEAKREVALLMQGNERHCREAWMASGFAVEFALKAYIMRVRKLNAWPERTENPELHIDNLRKLTQHAGIQTSKLPSELRAAFRVVLDWERHHDYNARHMPIRVAQDMVQAAFGADGVVEWLRKL